jgi:hypothetical protein
MSFLPEVGPQPVLVIDEQTGEEVPVLYGDGRTKQSFKDSTDINRIIQKAAGAGSLSHLVRHGATYGDFSDVPDLLTAHERLVKGRAIFDELPSEVKREFDGDMFKFFAYVNDPANADSLQEKLPALVQPGRQLPNVRRSAASEANPALNSAPEDVAAPVAPDAPLTASEPSASSST